MDLRGGYARAVNAFSATTAGTWVVRHVAAKVDPVLFARSGGRVTLTGVPTLPMLLLTVPGRRSGRPRRVQLGYLAQDLPDGGTAYLVVASAMGQEADPDWLRNLRAAGGGTVLVDGRIVEVRATELDPGERARVWPALVATIPQLRTYVRRTSRTIPVVRLTPGGPSRA